MNHLSLTNTSKIAWLTSSGCLKVLNASLPTTKELCLCAHYTHLGEGLVK